MRKKFYNEKEILESKTPEEYIDRSLNSKIKRGDKISLCCEWLRKTNYTSEDIKYARNRHPYWKKIKQEGYKERNERRWEKHSYIDYKIRKIWSHEKIETFIELNKKENGEYINIDVVMAKKLKTTIPSIQYWRRKFNCANKIMKKFKIKPRHFFTLMKSSDQFLKVTLNSDEINLYDIINSQNKRKLK